jgi:hypothetical protein
MVQAVLFHEEAAMQRVISDLFWHATPRPILVIAGGPSVTRDLASLPSDFRPALVLSANEHGCKQDRFKVDFIVNCDKKHCMLRVDMEEHLRPFGVPIINRWSWADVRLEDWTFAGNSGTTAVAVAAAIGGAPIVVTGIDFWGTGRRYFHDGTEAPTKKTYAWQRHDPMPITKPDKRLGALAEFCGNAVIRPMSGPMLTRWKRYHPGEQFGAAPIISYSRRVFATADYRAVRNFPFGNGDIVQAGTVLRLTKREADGFLRTGKIARCVPAE